MTAPARFAPLPHNVTRDGMTLTEECAAERIAKGAAFLDEHDPDWWRENVDRAIDLERLALHAGDRCVLGQRCPLEVFTNYRDRLGYAVGDDHRYIAYAAALTGMIANGWALDDWAENHGFTTLNHSMWTWDALTQAWADLITSRRKDAAERGELS